MNRREMLASTVCLPLIGIPTKVKGIELTKKQQAFVRRYCANPTMPAKKMTVVDRLHLQLAKRACEFDPRDMFDKNHKLLAIADMPITVKRFISKVTVDSEGGTKIELVDRKEIINKALEILKKYV